MEALPSRVLVGGGLGTDAERDNRVGAPVGDIVEEDLVCTCEEGVFLFSVVPFGLEAAAAFFPVGCLESTTFVDTSRALALV